MDADQNAPRVRFESGYGRLNVWAEVILAGEELLVYIGGGDRPHLGAFSVAKPRENPLSFSMPGHMDYIISSESSKRICEATGMMCAVVCGIHVDNAAPDEIESLIVNSRKCVDSILQNLRSRSSAD